MVWTGQKEPSVRIPVCARVGVRRAEGGRQGSLIPAHGGGNELEQHVNQELYADFQGSRLEERLVRMEGSIEAGTDLRNKYPEQSGDAGR